MNEIDEMLDGYVAQPPREEDWGLNKVNNWVYKFCWKPQECFLTGKSIWGKRAYYGTRIITGPGEPVYDEYWIDRDNFLLWQLTK